MKTPMAVLMAGLCVVASNPGFGAEREVATMVDKGAGVTALDVEGPRPMAMAVRSLVEKYGYRISYEDPRYAYADDFEDVTARYARTVPDEKGRKPPHIVVPKGGKFTVNLRPARGAETALNDTLAAASGSGSSVHFNVRKLNDMLEVVPSRARDRNGNDAVQTSVLDARITFPSQERTAYETLKALCDALTAVVGEKIHVGMTGFEPSGLVNPDEYRYLVGADDEPARIVLKRALDAIGTRHGPFAWLLLYGNPQMSEGYALNLVPVPEIAKNKLAPAASVPLRSGNGTSGSANNGTVVPGPK